MGICTLAAAFAMVFYSSSLEELSLSAALKEALSSNPEITAARRAHEAAAARIPQAAALKDPLLELEYNRINADRDLSGHPMTMYALSQEVPFPTKIYYRAKIAARLAKIAYENYRSKEREIINRVKTAYAELALVHRSVEIAVENKRIIDQFSGIATSRYGAGMGTQADALKAQVELAKIENELVMLEQRRITAQARLDILLNRDPSRELGAPRIDDAITRAPSLQELFSRARENNPELKAYRYGIERGDAAFKLSLNEFMPDLMLRFEQMVQRGNLQGGMWAGSLGVTIPLWFLQKQVFGAKEMKAELESLKAEYSGKENMVLFDIRDAYARAEANKKIADSYRASFIPQAEQTVNAALKGYESGKGDFLALLDSQRMLTEFKLDRYKAAIEFATALADLEKAVGVDLNIQKR
ncbi:MAG: TolC family protein [Candidatus Aureabacteria bacterium]|nr:TolC family protein [Candidatus Auribacterota bacterium]